MNYPNIIGWIGNVFFVIGVCLLAKRKIKGFYFNCFGNIAYIIQGILIQMNSILVISIFLISTNVYAILKWKTDGK